MAGTSFVIKSAISILVQKCQFFLESLTYNKVYLFYLKLYLPHVIYPSCCTYSVKKTFNRNGFYQKGGACFTFFGKRRRPTTAFGCSFCTIFTMPKPNKHR